MKSPEPAVPSHRTAHSPHPSPHQARPGSHGPYASQGQTQPKKTYPPTDTGAESYYYLKQMSKKTPMAFVFQDGEVLEGYIEWYDRNCIKLNREGAANLLVYKNALKYMYKLDEGKESSEEEGEPEGK
ncbi:MAG: RNA chaperone Hfq [Candidatus Aminicenantes bacterium]|nr:RNA chaperone Hfq [Candidatus Aminicenantes bacterium]